MPKKQFFSKKQREEIFDQAIAFWDSSTKKMGDYFDRINDYNRLYHVQLPQKLHDAYEAEPGRAAMVLPDIYNNVRSFRAHVHKLIFGTKPYATVSILGQPNQRNETVDKAETLLSALIDISKYEREADKINQQVCVAGTSACITDWHTAYRRSVRRDGANQPIRAKNGQFVFTERPVAAYPRMRGLDIRRARIDDKAENREDIRLVGYHVKQNLSELIRLNRSPDNFIIFDKEDVEKSVFPKVKYYEYATEESSFKDKEDKTPYGDRPMEIMEIRGNFQIDNEYVDLIVKIVNRQILIEGRPNNLPVYGWETIDFPSLDVEFNKIFTMGLIEPAEDVFIEQFIKRNQSIDASNHGTYPQYLGDMAAISELPDKMEYIGNKIHRINLAATGLGSIRDVFGIVPQAENPIDTFNQAERLRTDTQQTMRRSDYSQGTDPSRKETATAVNEITSSGLRDVEQAINFLGLTYLFPTWGKYLQLWDFYNGNRGNQVSTSEGKNIMIQPNEMNKPFEFTVDVAAALDRPVVMRRMIESAPFYMQAPEVVKYWYLKTMARMQELPNQDKILPPPDLMIAVVERENLALRMGIQLPVHESDDHAFHLDIHIKRADADSHDPEFNLTEEAVTAYTRHKDDHEAMMDKVNNPLGINTPNMTTDVSPANMSGGVSPRIKNTNLAGTTPG